MAERQLAERIYALCRLRWGTGIVAAVVAVVASAGPTAATPAHDMPTAPYANYVSEAAARFGLAEDWIWAVMRTESGGQPHAVSRVGAMGLMQLMPATWASLSAHYRLGIDPFDVHANILAGAAYLRLMLDRYGDVASTLAAYNAGPERVDDWRGRGRNLPAETMAYVARIAPALQANGIGKGRGSPTLRPSWRSASLFPAHVDGASGEGVTSSFGSSFRKGAGVSVPVFLAPNPAADGRLFTSRGSVAR